MRYPPAFLDDIRARLPVSDVVGRRVKLRKAGREWKGLSPFQQEKTPSFTVNDQKGFYKDFSSGKAGDIFTFVMETEGLSFPEAVERLAGIAGIPMPVASKDEEARASRRKTLHEVMELAAKFFEASLAGRTGAHARGYLADRRISPATQLKFRLGYAPGERFALKEHLGAQGISVPDMVEAGLLIAGDDIPVPYDRFRDRVIFPITDTRDRVIAFGGRALASDAQAKYLNSPETPLFHKGATLYNIGPARQAAHTGAPLTVVEGYIDVIAMVTAGFPATVAPLGTALTEQQLALLWRMADEPTLCFDGDGAGRRAAYRAVDIALAELQPGKSLRFALLPQGQDPDDLARSGGRDAIAEVLGSAAPLADMLWTRETEGGGFATPERRAALERRLIELTATIRDATVRKYYVDDMGARVRSLFNRAADNSRRPAGRGFGSRPPGRGAFPFEPAGPAPPSQRLTSTPIVRGFRSAIPPREALILMTVLNHPWLLEQHAEDFSDLEFRHADADRLRRAIFDAAADLPSADAASMRAAVEARGCADLLAAVAAALTHPSDWPAREEAAEDDVARWWDHVVTLHRKQMTLHRELRDAERALGEEPSDDHLRWLQDVQSRLSALEGAEALIEDFGVSSGRPARGF
jgi:DNA primase